MGLKRSFSLSPQVSGELAVYHVVSNLESYISSSTSRTIALGQSPSAHPHFSCPGPRPDLLSSALEYHEERLISSSVQPPPSRVWYELGPLAKVGCVYNCQSQQQPPHPFFPHHQIPLRQTLVYVIVALDTLHCQPDWDVE